jgi:hypothetical protein
MEELRRERERVEDAETDVRSVRLSLWCANGDPIIISIDRLRERAGWLPQERCGRPAVAKQTFLKGHQSVSHRVQVSARSMASGCPERQEGF